MNTPTHFAGQRGISLLEAVLSLSLISLMVAGGMRWVNDSTREHKAMALANQQSALARAARTYLSQHLQDVRFAHTATPGNWVAVRLGGTELPYQSDTNPGWGSMNAALPGLTGLAKGNLEKRQVCLMVQPVIGDMPLRALLMTRGSGAAPDVDLAKRAATLISIPTQVGTAPNLLDEGPAGTLDLATLIAPASYPADTGAGGCDAALSVNKGDLVTPLVINPDDGDVVSRDFLLRETDPAPDHAGNHFDTTEYLADSAATPTANSLRIEHGSAAAGNLGTLTLDGQSLSTDNYVMQADQTSADRSLSVATPGTPPAQTEAGDAAGSVDTRIQTNALVAGNGGMFFNRFRQDALPGNAIPFLAPQLNLQQPVDPAPPVDLATLPRVRVDSLLRLAGPSYSDSLAIYNYQDLYYTRGSVIHRNTVNKRPSGLSTPESFTLRGMVGPYAFNTYYLPAISDIFTQSKSDRDHGVPATYKDKSMDVTPAGQDTTFAHNRVIGVPCQPSGLLTLLGEYRGVAGAKGAGYKDANQTDPDYAAATLAYCAPPSRAKAGQPSTWYFPLISREPFNPDQVSWMLTRLNDPGTAGVAHHVWHAGSSPKKSDHDPLDQKPQHYNLSISYGQKSRAADQKFGVTNENALNRNPDLVEQGDLDWSMGDFPAKRDDFTPEATP